MGGFRFGSASPSDSSMNIDEKLKLSALALDTISKTCSLLIETPISGFNASAGGDKLTLDTYRHLRRPFVQFVDSSAAREGRPAFAAALPVESCSRRNSNYWTRTGCLWSTESAGPVTRRAEEHRRWAPAATSPERRH